MKKLLVFIMLLICLCVTFAFKNVKNPLWNMVGVDRVCLISSENYEKSLDVEAVNCGDLVFNFCTLEVARENISNIDLKGLEFYFSNIPINDVLKNLKADIVSEELVNSIYIINAYTPYFSQNVFVKNKKVNVQLAVSEGRLIAGFPMILTGF